MPVRVFNVNAQPICLAAGTVVAKLDQVEVCSVIVQNASDNVETERLDILKRMVDRVDPDVTNQDRERLTGLLL